MARNRYEIKYVIHRRTAQAFLARASRWMRHDPHLEGRRHYRVRSLYFDTADLRHYRDIVDGHCIKRKLRLRGYDAAGERGFFEVKTRRYRSVEKTRAPASLPEALDLVHDPFASALGRALGAATAEIARRPHLPILTVTYDRIALVDLLGSSLRVTLDENVRCGGPDLFSRPVGIDDLRVLPPGLHVLELKFDHRIPTWLSQTVADLELFARAYSKYGGGVERFRRHAPLVPELARHG